MKYILIMMIALMFIACDVSVPVAVGHATEINQTIGYCTDSHLEDGLVVHDWVLIVSEKVGWGLVDTTVELTQSLKSLIIFSHVIGETHVDETDTTLVNGQLNFNITKHDTVFFVPLFNMDNVETQSNIFVVNDTLLYDAHLHGEYTNVYPCESNVPVKYDVKHVEGS